MAVQIIMCLYIILLYTSMESAVNKNKILSQFKDNKFDTDMVVLLVIMIVIMIFDRYNYKARIVDQTSKT